MGQLPADTFRRIYLLYLLGQFPKGSFGLKRLHKVTYVSERDAPMRPFDYKRYHFGQYSDSLESVKDQLLSMGNVAAVPLDTATTYTWPVSKTEDITFTEGGNRIFLRDVSRLAVYRDVLNSGAPGTSQRIAGAVKDYGFLLEAELIEKAYAFPEFKASAMDEVIFLSNLPEYVDVQLSDDECADLALSLDPQVVTSLSNLSKVVESTDFDLDQVQTLDLRALGA